MTILKAIRNGVFAIGFFLGMVAMILIEPISQIFGIEARLWENDTLVGVAVSGAIGFAVAFWVYLVGKKEKSKHVATSVQYKIHQNLMCCSFHLVQIEGARKISERSTEMQNYGPALFLKKAEKVMIFERFEAEEVSGVLAFLTEGNRRDFLSLNHLLGMSAASMTEILEVRDGVLKEDKIDQRAMFYGGHFKTSPGVSKSLENVLPTLNDQLRDVEKDLKDAKEMMFRMMEVIETDLDAAIGEGSDLIRLRK